MNINQLSILLISITLCLFIHGSCLHSLLRTQQSLITRKMCTSYSHIYKDVQFVITKIYNIYTYKCSLLSNLQRCTVNYHIQCKTIGYTVYVSVKKKHLVHIYYSYLYKQHVIKVILFFLHSTGVIFSPQRG